MPGVLGKWEGALSWRDLTAPDGWRGDLGCIKTTAHERFINRVKWSVVCQIDRQEYIRKQDLRQTNVLASEYETVCDSHEGFSKVACKGESCSNSTQWKKLHSEPKQKLPNLTRLRKLPLGNVLVFYRCVTNYPKLSTLKQHPFLSSQFCSSWVWHSLAGFCSGSQKAEVKGQQGSIPVWRFWGRFCFQVHSGCWQDPVPRWLSARGLALSSLKLLTFLLCAPLHLWTSSGSSSPPHASNLSAFLLCFKVHVIKSSPLRWQSPYMKVSCAIEHNIITGGIVTGSWDRGLVEGRVLPTIGKNCPVWLWVEFYPGKLGPRSLIYPWKRTDLSCSIWLVCLLNELQKIVFLPKGDCSVF